MFNFCKKKKTNIKEDIRDFDIELTASMLAYEIARSDGNVSKSELILLMEQIKKISSKVGKKEEEILRIVEIYRKNSVSVYEFINDINRDFSKDDKLTLIQFLFDVAYADKNLEVNEEKLIRRIADMIHIKDIDVLKIKDTSKKKINNL